MNVRHYILKDGQQIASTAEIEVALDMVRNYQAKETHYMLRAAFSIISGEEVCIPYETGKKKKAKA